LQYVFTIYKFKGDKELFEKYHIIRSTEDNCIKDTINKIEEFYDNISSSMSYKFYGLKEDGKIVGYFTKCEIKEGKYNEILHSFGININHRNKKTFKRFMEILENFFDDRIVVGLYKKNTRAISFLEKNNFLITQIEDDYLFLSKRI
jgi:TRAP-type uncharacterized transport system substrate-binding protein